MGICQTKVPDNTHQLYFMYGNKGGDGMLVTYVACYVSWDRLTITSEADVE